VPIPDFVAELRHRLGDHLLWLPGVTAVIRRDEEILLVQRSDNHQWTPVTGIVDPGEEPAVAGAREVLEEASVVAVPERLTWVHVLPPMVYDNGDRAQYLDHTFRFRYVSGEPFPADGENTEAAWFALDALPPMSAEMHARIASVLAPAGPAAFGS
jgi:8-oxo-dGTP pyrophosphatase MutT (NUDIX family)